MIGMNAQTMVPLLLPLVVVVKMVGGWQLLAWATPMSLSPLVRFVRALGDLLFPLPIPFYFVQPHGPPTPSTASLKNVLAMANSLMGNVFVITPLY
jgi:hypothetical protein